MEVDRRKALRYRVPPQLLIAPLFSGDIGLCIIDWQETRFYIEGQHFKAFQALSTLHSGIT